MPSICFVNSDNYPVLNPKYGSHYIGGESVQQTLLAREFVRQGWDVSMICEDFGQPDGESVDDIRVWKTFHADAGLPGLRFLYPRLYRIWRALGKTNAHYFYQSCAGVMTGFVAAYARSHGKRMIFRVAHDTDCVPGEQLIRFSRDRKIYEYGLRRADIVSAQSAQQAELLSANYDLDSTVINMAVEIPDSPSAVDRDIDVLWVNNLRPFKRPDLLCEIAVAMPERSFAMIGGPVSGHEELHDRIRSAAERIPNLTCVGAVPYHEVNDFFVRSKLFLNTSDSEGFPNSFLQAWARELPVISFFDPDGIIESRDLGRSPDSLTDACEVIARLLDSDALRQSIGENARRFVIRRFAPAAVVGEYMSRMESLRA